MLLHDLTVPATTTTTAAATTTTTTITVTVTVSITVIFTIHGRSTLPPGPWTEEAACRFELCCPNSENILVVIIVVITVLIGIVELRMMIMQQ